MAEKQAAPANHSGGPRQNHLLVREKTVGLAGPAHFGRALVWDTGSQSAEVCASTLLQLLGGQRAKKAPSSLVWPMQGCFSCCYAPQVRAEGQLSFPSPSFACCSLHYPVLRLICTTSSSATAAALAQVASATSRPTSPTASTAAGGCKLLASARCPTFAARACMHAYF